ncbi:hypothetical protein P154DRAFT_614214 [Amniculicola lignicola CBS 123094]|uniref:WW domain-containing protein n=1 Tax=Amniculicola lignicola CBS 123094 TaxID=1392246 RepID=A0A6A5X4G6_9PLEO|nr:hypothetical protein P154DRAFT_614214 [Amniculicola lignicola CBS 123094]
MATLQPPDAPPSYEHAISGAATPTRVSTEISGERTDRNGIPMSRRRSMEDENRALPPGWVRQFDPQEQHQFFVDTNHDPPRSTWVHPYDDPNFLSTLSPEERRKHSRRLRTMTTDDIGAESSDDEAGPSSMPKVSRLQPSSGKAGANTPTDEPHGLHKFTRKMKDKLTSTTHEQRADERVRREEQERRAYIAHLKARQAKAIETGEPQFLCKDAQGRDVYIESPYGRRAPHGAFGWSPYAPSGPYGSPNVRYVRPSAPYGRPYGYGYGGGIGAPVAAGFLGGAMLGGLLF